MARRFAATALIGLICATLASACADNAGGDNTPNLDEGGKADDGVSNACASEWNLWFLERFAPMSCTDGPACVGKVALSTQPACPGGVLHDTWMLGFKKHIVQPWMAREAAARVAFYTGDSPAHQDTTRFAEAVAPTAAEQAAMEKLLQVPTLASDMDYLFWLPNFAVWIETVARPVRTMINASVDGRLLCGDVPAPCDAEPSLFVNAGEKAFLQMFHRTAPKGNADGDFAVWNSTYFDFLTLDSSASGTQFVFPETDLEPALFPYEIDFFEYLLSIAPKAIGEKDSLKWFDLYTAIVLGTRFDQQNSLERLVLFEMSRPEALVGLPAYASFLGKDGGLSGLALFEADDSDRVALILQAKPCARDAAELAAMQALHDTYRGIARTEAAPEPCAD